MNDRISTPIRKVTSYLNYFTLTFIFLLSFQPFLKVSAQEEDDSPADTAAIHALARKTQNSNIPRTWEPLIPLVNNSQCANSDFSSGTFLNWKGCFGTWCNNVNRSQTHCATGLYVPFNDPCNNISSTWTDNPTGGHFSIETPGTDPCIGGLQKVFPGDAFSARIGNRTCSSGGGGYCDKLTYQITYDPNNSFFIYRCAVVLENPNDPSHNTPDRKPRFLFEIRDQASGALVDPVCGVYDLTPGDGITVWQNGPSDFLYKDWSTIGIDFNALNGLVPGQILNIVFTVHGCAMTAHTAYAYISCFCGSMSIANTGCNGSGSVTLTGPPGFTTYEWQGPYCPTCPPSPPTYTENPITITAAQGAITGNTFNLTLTALNGCQVVNVQQIIAFTTINAGFRDSLGCAQRSSFFFDTSTVSQNAVTAWQWDFGDPASAGLNTSTLQNPIHAFTAAGTYNVRLISFSTEGCPDTITRQVVIGDLVVITSTNHRSEICSGQHAIIPLTANFADAQYTWTATASSVNVTEFSNNAVPAPSPIDQILLNGGTVVDSVTYIITPHESSCIGDPYTFRVIVYPTPTATIAPATIAVCQNAASPLITFTGASGTAPYTFSYRLNGGPIQNISTVVGNSVTLAAPTGVVGVFNYSLTNVQDASPNTCSQPQAGSAVVTVNPLPTATISGTIAVCKNSASPLVTFTGAAATAPYTFTYTINGGPNLFVTTAVGNSVTVAAPTGVAGVFTYTLVSVHDGSGTACSQPQAGTVLVTVNDLPTATIGETIAVCQNSPSPLITFTGATTIAPYTFTYNINGGPNLFVTTVAGSSVTVPAPTNIVGVFTYTLVSVQDGSATTCSQLQAGSAVVTVNDLPTATILGTIAVCKNSVSPNITFTGASATAPYTFTYTVNGGANQFVTTVVGNSITVAAPTGVVGAFIYNLVSVQDGSGTACIQAQAGSAVVTVNPLPTATISGTTDVCQSSAPPLITFTGASATAPYTFTYNINGGANLFVTTIVGNSVTVVAPTGVVGVFTYTLVSVQDGSATTCSQLQAGSAIVTVNPLPTATISETIAVCKNSASPLITFTGASATAPYTFTYNVNGGPNQNVTTVVGNSITVAAPTGGVGVYTYNLLSVQDGSGTACVQAQAGSAVVTVNDLPTATISGTIDVCQSSAPPLITFTGANTSAPYTFTYKINGGPNLVVTTIAGNSVTVAAPTGVVGPFTYSLVSVQDGSPTTCSQAQAGSAVVTVNPLPTATISGTTGVCQNAASPLITFTGASSTAPYTFTYNINGGPNQNVTTVAGNSVTIATPTGVVGVFTYNLISVQDGSATTCSQPQAGSAVVTVNSLPVPTVTGAAAVCLNTSSVYTTESGMTAYSWTVSAGGTITAGGSTSAITVNWTTTGLKTITVNYFNGNNCTATTASTYNVMVNLLPAPPLNGFITTCVNTTVNYSTDPGMSNYIWTVSAGGSITGGGGTTDNFADVLWNTSGPQTISVNYNMATGCSATMPTVLNVAIKPRPAITNASGMTICSNGTTNFTFASTFIGTTYTWTASGSSGNVSGYSNGARAGIFQTLVNAGFNIEIVTYTVTPNLNGCDGPTANFTVNVNPVADVYFTPNGQSFCSGGTTNITIASHVAGTTFTWTATGSSFNVSGYSPGNDTLIAQTLVNSGPWFESVDYQVFPVANSCPGTNNNHVIVNMNPTPQVSLDMNCNDIITTTDAKPFTLKGGIPLGGTYSGPGVTAGIFYPSLAGPGLKTINYSYANTWGCNANLSQNISVISGIPFNCDNILTDMRDNKQYPTVKIGTQCWMAKNLDIGTQIASSAMQRDNCVLEKYCNGEDPANCTSMGGLYQWDEMMRFEDTPALQGICPPAWHIPTENDWATLFSFYISNGFAGSPLKWDGYSGFNAFLYGTRFDNANYFFTGFSTFIWSSNSDGPNKAWAHAMNTFNPSVSNYPGNRSNAFSVRCIKD